MQINNERLHRYFTEMAKNGATELGGVHRLALTDEDKAGRDLFIEWLKAIGLSVRVDDMGNIYGRYSSGNEDKPPVIIGSHLDSVYQGGKFDGALGVLAGLEVLHTLSENKVQTAFPVEVVSFTNEEGTRFQPAVISSGVLAGEFSLDFAYSRPDQDGITLGAELERIGYKGDSANRPSQVQAYLEMHIEQGPILEETGIDIGVVEGIQGATWLEISLIGQANHAGTTPMNRRQDAMVAASRIILAVREIAAQKVPNTVATVGKLRIEPNIVNAIPGKVVLAVDLRQPDNPKLQEAVGLVKATLAQICEEEKVKYEINQLWLSSTVMFNEKVVGTVEQAAKNLGFSYRRMLSGAGHDAMYMARLGATGMIFVPTIDGKSHCQEESARWEAVVNATNVLLETTLHLAQAQIAIPA
jgi:beta-ureidopropionase / N-carbamoyl-L-amino-acid hydrolase